MRSSTVVATIASLIATLVLGLSGFASAEKTPQPGGPGVAPDPDAVPPAALANCHAGTPVSFSYSGSPVAIPDGADITGNNPGAAVMVPVLVSGVGAKVFDVDVSIDGTSCSVAAGSTTVGIDHTFVNDLKITLQSPASTSVLVINRTDGVGNNFCQTVLDDESAGASIQTVSTANAPFTGSFTPNAPLSTFDGENADGTWNLIAQDFLAFDTGSVRAWTVTITPAVCTQAQPAPAMSWYGLGITFLFLTWVAITRLRRAGGNAPIDG
jgi:subtilisin-like proprotein convertase family protein